MDGFLEMEAQREGQLELESRQVRRNRLHLVSAVAQWIVLLSCLIYFGLGFLHPPTTAGSLSQWVEVKAKRDNNTKEKRLNISAYQGTMRVRNRSIPIHCDGFYLVSLKGMIIRTSQGNSTPILKVYKRPEVSILDMKVTEKPEDLVTVSEMFFQDEVYLEANNDANYQGLTLGLFLLTPSSRCSDDMDKM